MGAYAALLSLSHTLDQILFLDQYPLPFKKEQLVSIKGNVSILLTVLEDYSQKYREGVNPLESRIIDAAYKAENIIESQLLSPWTSTVTDMMLSCKSSNSKLKSVCENLHKALQEINFVLEEGMQMQNTDLIETNSPPEFKDFASSSGVASSDVNRTVGLDDDFKLIKERMYEELSTFRVIPIVGMGGIGKTTLARRLYEDAIKMQYFDICVWIVVSQDYSLKKILLSILRSIKKPIDEGCTDHELLKLIQEEQAKKKLKKANDVRRVQGQSNILSRVLSKDTKEGQVPKKITDGDLVQIVHQELFGRRYLVVADDVWSAEAWDILNRVLPKETEGCQVVLVTTRLRGVANHVGSSSCIPHEIDFLNKEQSWRLFANRVFGERRCPPQLEWIGKEIANCCRGLPLMITVVTGLLKEDVTEKYWRSTLGEISSATHTNIMLQCSKVLSLSYDNLPIYLKPCFLYVTAFPEDYEVKVNQLVRLWMAEGFVKPSGLDCLEEVANGYLDDLVGRSLLIVSRRKYGKIKSVKVHDSLRDIGKVKAQQERFHDHDVASKWSGQRPRVSCDVSDFRLCLSKFGNAISFENHQMFRVVDSFNELLKVNPKKLLLLRYFAIKYSKETRGFSKSAYARYINFSVKLVCKIPNLQSIVIKAHAPLRLSLHQKCWTLPFLRHMIFRKSIKFEQLAESEIVQETSLQTLSQARDLMLSLNTIKMLANVRKLDLQYTEGGAWRKFELKNLVHLQKLEELKIEFPYNTWRDGIWSVDNLALPHSLKKLHVKHAGFMWDDMKIVGSLPNLEVLKLIHSCLDGRWKPVEGQFLKLKYLEIASFYLDNWGVENIHFPGLKFLVLKGMGEGLMEIPSEIGGIDALEVIELHDCLPSIVASAKQIQAQQQDMGNEYLQVLVFDN